MGDGLKLGLDAARTRFPDGQGDLRRLPAAIVLLSDGAQTHGSADPVQIAGQAGKANVPIYAVALGTPHGLLRTRTGAQVRGAARHRHAAGDRARLARARLQRHRRRAGWRTSSATSARAWPSRHEQREITGAFAGGALLALLLGAVISLLRTGRLP